MRQSWNALLLRPAARMVLAALLLSTVLQRPAAAADAPPSLFLAAPPPAAAAARGLAPEEKRARLAALNVPALRGDASVAARAIGARTMTLNLFDNAVYTAVFNRVNVTGPDSVVYTGSLDGIPGTQVTLSVVGDALAAIIDLPGKAHFAVNCAGNGAHRIVEFDPGVLPPTLEKYVPMLDAIPPSAAASRAVTQVDVMVIYTAAVLNNNGGTASGVKALIDLAISDANTALSNSGINVQFKLVYSGQTSYVTSGDDATDLNRLTATDDGYMDDVHTLRNDYGADLVCLLNTNNRGIAWVPKPPTASSSGYGFCVVGDDRVKDHTYIHESGHNFGCAHDRANSSSSGAFDYSYGYVFTAEGTEYGTVMAYPGERIAYFSNPAVTYRGVATGIAEGSPDAANNAKAINQTAATIAGYRNTVDPISQPNTPPAVSITAPAANASFAGPLDITITADASDPDAGDSVTKVEFFADSTKLGEVTASPFSFIWTAAPAGNYTLSAVAYDKNAAQTTSAGIAITITSPTSPVNDNFANRIAISGLPSGAVGSNVDATRETGEPNHAGLQCRRSVWWTWTPADAGGIQITAKGEGFEPVLAVYTGTSVSTLAPVASDSGIYTPHGTRLVKFAAVAGTAYQIVVDTANGAAGKVTVTIATDDGSRPVNDDFANRIVLSGATVATFGSNSGATLQTAEGEPRHADRDVSGSVWWEWTAPANGPVVISTAGSTFDTVLAVYTGDSVGSLSEAVVYNDDAGTEVLTSRASFVASAGTAYQIAVASFGTPEGGTHDLALSISPVATTPPNDAFANATPITLTNNFAHVSGSNEGATAETNEPAHYTSPAGPDAYSSPAAYSVWWSWTAPAGGGSVTLSTQGSTFDTVLAVYTGSAINALTKVADNDDEDYTNNVFTSMLTFSAVAGTTYYIAVDGSINALDMFGNIELAIWMGTTPANDAFASAIDLLNLATCTGEGTNVGASGESGEPRHANATGDPDATDGIDLTKWASVWWKWTAPATGTVTITTEGSTFDTVLAVYTGTAVNALTEVASNDDASSTTLTSTVRFNVATAGTVYYIAVDGWSARTGAVKLGIKQATPPSASVAATASNASESGPVKATFTITLTASASPITVRYSLGGLAINGTDYAPTPTSVKILAGATTATVDITPIDDTAVEGTEDVTITLLNDQAYLMGATTSASATIADNDELPIVTLAATDASASEWGDPGLFTITREGNTAGELTVDLDIGGTAVGGTNYETIPASVTFAAGAASATIEIKPLWNDVSTGDQTVTIGIVSVSGLILGSPSSGTVTIADFSSTEVVVQSPKHKFALNFSKKPKDSLDFSLTDTASLGYTDKTKFGAATNGKPIAVAVGPAQIDSATLASGKATGKGKFQWNYKKGEVRYSLKNTNLQDLLLPYGAENKTMTGAIEVPLFIGFGDKWYGGTYPFTYKAKAGKSGSGK